MSLIQDLVEWASSGDVSPAYDDAKKALGWVVGEPPSAPGWNEVENARDRMINRVKYLSDAKGTASPHLSPAGLCSGQLYGTDRSNLASAFNHFTLSEEMMDACVCWDSTIETPFILVLLTDGTFVKITECWSYESGLGNEVIEPTFASTPDDIHALCCDGTNVYIAWSITGGNILVSAHPLSNLEGAAAWTCDTGESYLAGGPKLLVDHVSERVMMVTRVSLGDTKRILYTINSTDGSLVGSGTGSWVTGYGDECANSHFRPIYYAGHVWWIQYNTVSSDRHFYLMSAKVSAPSTSDYSSIDLGSPVATSDTWLHPKALAQANGGLAVINAAGVVGYVRMSMSPTYVAGLLSIVGEPAPNMEGDQDVLTTNDGQNVWVLSAHATAGPVYRPVLYCIPTASLRQIGVVINPASALLAIPINTEATDPAEVEETDIGGRLLFDGMDVWCILRSGMVFRITNPGGR